MVPGSEIEGPARPTAGGELSRPAGPRASWWKRVARSVLLVLGIAAVVLLVRNAGPEEVLSTLLSAGSWLPLVVFLECCFMGMDAVALRSLMGERGRRVPMAVWVRTALLQYGVMQLLPAGRAGGEIARAAGLAGHVGGAARAAAAATRLQAATMLANTFISVPCYVAVAFAVGAHSPLGYAVLVNALITALIGSALLLTVRRSRFGGWLGQRVAFLKMHGPTFDEALREGTPWTPAIVATSIGRVFQTVQYGVILVAVGATLTAGSPWVAQGIHLVGAGMGDMVPNQVGITEGAYTLFAPALGLEGDVARAIGIALIARICQFSLAGTCLVISALWNPRSE